MERSPESVSGKRLVRAALAAWARGRKPALSVRLTAEQVEALSEVLGATKRFEAALTEARSVESLMSLLEAKRHSASNFYRVTGIAWPL